MSLCEVTWIVRKLAVNKNIKTLALKYRTATFDSILKLNHILLNSFHKLVILFPIHSSFTIMNLGSAPQYLQ